MTPFQFVKDNLPDYEKTRKKLEERRRKSGEYDEKHRVTEFDMLVDYFGEAIENFRQTVWREACEEMRKLCISEYSAGWTLDCDNCYDRNIDRIKNITVPKPPKNE